MKAAKFLEWTYIMITYIAVLWRAYMNVIMKKSNDDIINDDV